MSSGHLERVSITQHRAAGLLAGFNALGQGDLLTHRAAKFLHTVHPATTHGLSLIHI